MMLAGLSMTAASAAVIVEKAATPNILPVTTSSMPLEATVSPGERPPGPTLFVITHESFTHTSDDNGSESVTSLPLPPTYETTSGCELSRTTDPSVSPANVP